MNQLKKKMAEGQRPIGTFAVTGSYAMTEATGMAGMDYVIIDNEHSPVEAETSERMIMAAENTGMTALCRVREISRPAVLKLLDCGAEGLIVPGVKKVEEVKRLVEYAKYRPLGDRGYSTSRKDGFGYKYDMPLPELLRYFNDNVLVIPQCETVEALESIEEITAIDGIDGIFVGPFDLSIAMGMPGAFDDPVFLAALKKVVYACRKAGKFSLIFTGDPKRVESYFSLGFDSVALGTDAGMYIAAVRSALDDIR